MLKLYSKACWALTQLKTKSVMRKFFLLMIGPVTIIKIPTHFFTNKLIFVHLCSYDDLFIPSPDTLLGSLALENPLELPWVQQIVVRVDMFVDCGNHSSSSFGFRLVELVWLVTVKAL